MRATWTVATIEGTEVKVHVTFSILVAWFVMFAIGMGHTPATLASALLLLILTCVCLIAHEFGHVAAARAYGIGTPEVTLLPIGAVSRLERNPDHALADILISAAGPAVSLALAGLALVGAVIEGDGNRLALGDVALAGFGAKLFWSNVLIAAMNLLPALPLDGGKLARAILTLMIGNRPATRLTIGMSYATGVALAYAGLHVEPIFFVMAALVFYCAKREGGRLRAEQLVQALTVRAAISTDFLTLAPGAPIVGIVEQVFTTKQREFPVLDGGFLVGIATRAVLAKGMGGGNSAALVAEVMVATFPVARPEEALAAACDRMAAAGVGLIPVVDDAGLLLGVVFSADASEREQEHAVQRDALNTAS